MTFADGTPGRLACEGIGEPVTCQALTDGSMKTAEEAGTLYVLQAEGAEPSPLVALVQAAGYTVEVQEGEALTLPTPEPIPRRRSN